MVAGAAFSAGALIVLMGPTLLHPQDWSSYQFLTILTVFGTITAGHLMVDAGRALHVSALGFFVLFLVGTGLVVYNSVGRQAEASSVTEMTAEATNKAIHDKYDDLDAAKDRKAEAADMIALYTNGGRHPRTGRKIEPHCGDVCKDWKVREGEIDANIEKIEAQIKSLGPQKPVHAKATKFAEMAALFGADKQKAGALAALIEPLLWCLFFEFGSIVSLGFAFRPRRMIDVTPEQVPEPVYTGNVSPLHPVARALQEHGGQVKSNRTLAALMNCSDGEASKRAGEAESLGLVERQQCGKEVRIRLKAAG